MGDAESYARDVGLFSKDFGVDGTELWRCIPGCCGADKSEDVELGAVAYERGEEGACSTDCCGFGVDLGDDIVDIWRVVADQGTT